MKVLFQGRPDMFANPGGDTVQMVKTAEYLRKAGVQADLSLQSSPSLCEYDLVHLFNITDVSHTYAQALNATQQGKTYVVSPIYWRENELVTSSVARLLLSGLFLPYLKALATSLLISDSSKTKTLREPYLRYQSGRRRMQVFVLNHADLVLPNANGERRILLDDFPEIRGKAKFFIVPNGVDTELFGGMSEESQIDVADYVLMVARFDLRKNQMGLIRALRHSEIPLVLVGDPAPSILAHEYHSRCKKEAGKGVLFLRNLNHDQLPPLYSNSKVHALPSFYETPGLASLEAAISGANIVSTNRGTAFEYLGESAWYCSPLDTESIGNAVLDAYNAPRSACLSRFIASNYSWEIVASKTKWAYQNLASADSFLQ